MKNKFLLIIFFFPFILIFLTLPQCIGKKYIVKKDNLSASKSYYSNLPTENISIYLKKAETYVKFVSSICYYRGYVLPEKLMINENEARLLDLQKLAEKEVFFNRTSSGTAVVLYSDIEKALLLTCAHVINFPDTIISYYYIESSKENIIETIGFRTKQEFYVSNIPDYDSIEVIHYDRSLDIAFILVHLKRGITPSLIPSWEFPFGNSDRLSVGNFIYLVGYPSGFKLVTKGIVGSIKSDKGGEIIVDAPFNRGASGSIVLAINSRTGVVEIVGIARSSAADFLQYLAPESGSVLESNENLTPYRGEIYISRYSSIKYGITQVVPINAIRNHIRKNRSLFNKHRINIDNIRM